jgi:hypothetical protein
MGGLLAGSPSAVLQSGGGRPAALVLCGAGSREVFGHCRLAEPTDYTHSFASAPAGYSRGITGTELWPLGWRLGFGEIKLFDNMRWK